MCVFCEIVKGNIPSYKVYEDDLCIAILDISQATIGHTLVIPKQHFKNIFEIDKDLAAHLFKVVTILSKKIAKALNVDNMNILNNNGPIAGQSVDHFHIHIIPRYKDDNLEIKFSSNKLTPEEFNDLLNKIK